MKVGELATYFLVSLEVIQTSRSDPSETNVIRISALRKGYLKKHHLKNRKQQQQDRKST